MDTERPSSLSVFWVSIGKVDPNPFQPRKEFSKESLEELAQSIRQYGILQPLVVTKREVMGDDGAMTARYELIAGERRLRAAEIAGIDDVPVIIRTDDLDNKARLELAIIENLQREDLNPVDRALAFKQLIDEFNVSRVEISNRLGRSREYVSNTLRLLMLPDRMSQALTEKKITEGHTRPLLMLSEKPEEQEALFREILNRKITVRDAESLARRHAGSRVRKKEGNPYVVKAQTAMEGLLDTRVHIKTRGSEEGGKIVIDFFSEQDLETIIGKLQQAKEAASSDVFPDEIPAADTEMAGDVTDDDDVYTFRNFSL